MNTKSLKFGMVTVVIILAIFSHKGLCQSYPVIDLDKVTVIELPEISPEKNPLRDGLPYFNDIVAIKSKSITPYMTGYISGRNAISILKGTVFVDLEKKISAYDLESANEITNENKPFQYRYKVFEFQKKKLHQSLLGTSYNVINYLSSIDQITGDTLWIKQGRYLTVCQATTVSYVSDFIIDNKTGEELFKLNSSKRLGISHVKEDNGFLYLMSINRPKSELIALNLNKGEVAWRIQGNFNAFLIDETRIYTSNQCAIDKSTGKLIWSNNSEVWIVGVVGNYLIGSKYLAEYDPVVFVYNKDTGKLAANLWSDNEFCSDCLGYGLCSPEFVFAEQGEGNRTAALVQCSDGVYLYTFEVVGEN